MARTKGRHPLPPDARRSERVNLRMTVGEVDAAYRAAWRHQLPLSTLLRAGLAHVMKRPPRPRE